MRFAFERVEHWPPLAWLATCAPGEDCVAVRHGPSVVCTPDWFCEAIWDGPYADGDFDRTDRVFGSGGRMRPEGAVFVSSATTVDRLCSVARDGVTCVSNSLACLVANGSLSFDPAESDAIDVMASAARGIHDHRRALPGRNGPVRLTLHTNLLWDGRALAERPKPDPARDFSSFERYRAFLTESFAALADNLRAPERAAPFDIVSTASSGYDSNTVTVLAAAIGLRDVITIEESRYERDDSGLFLIEHLGLNPVRVGRRPARVRRFLDVPFLIGDAVGRDVFLAGAEDKLAGRVLFSGYYGDSVWGLRDAPEPGRELPRQGGVSGLSLTEYRLWVGFLHCPAPFLGARDVAQLRALGRSESMRPWRRGGSYDRPIPRRIIEDTGVSGELFGTSKKVAGLLPSYRPDLELLRQRDPEAAADVRAWFRTHAREWWRRGRVPPLWGDALESALVTVVRFAWQILAPLLVRDDATRRHQLHTLLARLPPTRVSRHLFPWAMSRAVARYATPAHEERNR